MSSSARKETSKHKWRQRLHRSMKRWKSSRYKVYLEEAEIKRMAGHYGLEMNDSPALIGKMPDWRGTEGGLDEIGLFSWATANPQGRWDWYEIGGRWDGPFRGRNVIKCEDVASICPT